jgi:RNA polymerase sigma-70 factor (ECF subfamily)
MNTPDLEEKLAVARLKQGDLNGMETLVKRYQVQAVYAAYLIVRDIHLAEDLTQAAFLRAAQKIAQFDPERPFKAWFLRSVINAAIKAAKQQKRLIPLDGDPDEADETILEWLQDRSPGPDAIAENNETRQAVWRALAKLTPEQRAVIVMRHFLEMSETEMTLELERPMTTIRWWLRTARVQLKEILRPFWLSDHRDWQDQKETKR